MNNESEIEHHKKMYAELLMSFRWAENRNKELRSLLKRSLKLPRPWIPINPTITWEEWNSIFTDIEKVLAEE